MSAPARPTFVNRNANRAERASTRRSAASAMTAPAPAATPFTAATIGSGHSRISRTTAPVMRVNSSSVRWSEPSSAPMISCTSPPEQKPRPAPVITSARTSSRWGSSASTSRRSAYASNVSAFSFSGRSNVTVAIPSAIPTRRYFHDSVNPAEARKGVTSVVLVEATAALASEPPRRHHAAEHGRRLVPFVPELGVQNVGDVDTRVDPHEVHERERSHRVPEPERDRGVDILAGGEPLVVQGRRVVHTAQHEGAYVEAC